MVSIVEKGRQNRHRRVRKRIFGTHRRPRLCIHRSGKNLYAQIIDDVSNKTLYSISTLNKRYKEVALRQSGNDVESARILGRVLAEDVINNGIIRVVFDRGGYLYHGRVKAFAEAAREGGLEF